MERNWNVAIERIARTAHNNFMADDFDDLPEDGIERAIWMQVGRAVVIEMQTMMDEFKATNSDTTTEKLQ